MTAEQKLEAIKALINGVWDNEQLVKVGLLYADQKANIIMIIEGDY